MESSNTIETTYDRVSELKAFDETKTGVNGLLESGITRLPRIFHHPQVNRTSLKHPSSTVKIPIIDLGGGMLEESTEARKSLVAKVSNAMEKFGFFQAINHGVPVDVMAKMRDGVRSFHEQGPEVRKMFYSRDKTKKVKYISNIDLFESPAACWRDTLYTTMAPDVPKLEELPNVCGEIMLEYSKRVMKLAEFVFELLSEALGLNPNHLKEMDCVEGMVMLSHYCPPCPEPDLTMGGAHHTDRSFLTIVLQDDIDAFQLLHDECWIDVRPNPEALIFNIGDLLQLMSNDKFVSVEHKVLANGAQEPRISTACFFVHPLLDSRVYGPIKELLSEQNPPKYRETTAELSNHYVARKPGLNSSLLHLRI